MSSMLEKLDIGGLIWSFKPTNETLINYLHNQIRVGGTPNSLEIEIYGKSGMEPWVIWDSNPDFKIPHQDFFYLYTRVKPLSKSGKGNRYSRTLGSGGKWSETSRPEHFYVPHLCVSATLRKFRYEHTGFEHHAGWLMDEFSIDRSCLDSNLVLCRIKINETNNKRKRKDDHDDNDDDEIAKKAFKLSDTLPPPPQDWFGFDEEKLFNSDPTECIDVDDSYSMLHEEQHQEQLFLPPPFNTYHNGTSGDKVESSENESAVTETEDTGWLDQAIEEESTTATCPPFTLQPQHHSTGNDFSFSWDDDIIPTDAATNFQPDDDLFNSFELPELVPHHGADLQ